METITIRGEHLINLYRYAHEPSYRLMFGENEGYTAEFAVRHDQIMQKVLDSPDQPVKVVVGCDDVCLKTCPYDLFHPRQLKTSVSARRRRSTMHVLVHRTPIPRGPLPALCFASLVMWIVKQRLERSCGGVLREREWR